MPEVDVFGTPDIKPREFAQIKSFAQDVFGLDLRQGRERLVSARLGKQLKAGGFKSFEDYFRFVQSDRTGESLICLIDALTTNHTSFMREREHFEFMNSRIVPEFASRREFRVWSSACSTGEEPYSILFSYLEALGSTRRQDIRITATDISSKVLAIAREGVYAGERVQTFPAAWVSKYFDRSSVKDQDVFRVKAPYRQHITYRRLNLMDPFPPSDRYPLILCRNVMIYFNKATQTRLVGKLCACLEPGGYLFVGHAESLTGIDHPLKYVKPAIYRKAT
jgi:chemotaxis protein methyltransferase CheR